MRELEHKYQKVVIAWFDRQFKEHRGRLFAIPNGGHRHPAVAAKLRAEGVRPGVPDLMLPVARCGFHGLFIEMKADKGKVRGNQQDWHEYLDAQGYLVAVCFNPEAAMDTIKSYLAGDDNAD